MNDNDRRAYGLELNPLDTYAEVDRERFRELSFLETNKDLIKTQTMKTNEIKIDHDIPIPSKGYASKGYSQVLKAMKAGDSFLYKGHSPAGIRSASWRYGIKVATRKEWEGFRIWRTE